MKVKAREFDKRFEEGGTVTGMLDLGKAARPGIEQKRVNVDFPKWMVERLDREANRVGVTRQSIIKLWVAEHLEKEAASH